jgi:hypothetical protein
MRSFAAVLLEAETGELTAEALTATPLIGGDDAT